MQNIKNKFKTKNYSWKSALKSIVLLSVSVGLILFGRLLVQVFTSDLFIYNKINGAQFISLMDNSLLLSWVVRGIGIGMFVGLIVFRQLHFKISIKQILALSAIICCLIMISPIFETPLVQADVVNTIAQGYKITMGTGLGYDWIAGQLSDGSYFAVQGSSGNLMTSVEPWQSSAPWAAYASSYTSIETQILSTVSSGIVYCFDIPFAMSLTSSIPANVRVIDDMNGVQINFINQSTSSGSPYTISVGSGVTSGYYTAADVKGYICWTSTNATQVEAFTAGNMSSGILQLNNVAWNTSVIIPANVQVRGLTSDGQTIIYTENNPLGLVESLNQAPMFYDNFQSNSSTAYSGSFGNCTIVSNPNTVGYSGLCTYVAGGVSEFYYQLPTYGTSNTPSILYNSYMSYIPNFNSIANGQEIIPISIINWENDEGAFLEIKNNNGMYNYMLVTNVAGGAPIYTYNFINASAGQHFYEVECYKGNNNTSTAGFIKAWVDGVYVGSITNVIFPNDVNGVCEYGSTFASATGTLMYVNQATISTSFINSPQKSNTFATVSTYIPISSSYVTNLNNTGTLDYPQNKGGSVCTNIIPAMLFPVNAQWYFTVTTQTPNNNGWIYFTLWDLSSNSAVPNANVNITIGSGYTDYSAISISFTLSTIANANGADQYTYKFTNQAFSSTQTFRVDNVGLYCTYPVEQT